MGFFDELGEKAKKGLDMAGEKTNELVGVAKVKYEISGLNSELGKAFEKLGRFVYEAAQSGEDHQGRVEEMLSEINELKARLSDAQDRLNQGK